MRVKLQTNILHMAREKKLFVSQEGKKAVISWPRIYEIKLNVPFGEKVVIQKGKTSGLEKESCIK